MERASSSFVMAMTSSNESDRVKPAFAAIPGSSDFAAVQAGCSSSSCLSLQVSGRLLYPPLAPPLASSASGRALDEDVLRLDVAVHDAVRAEQPHDLTRRWPAATLYTFGVRLAVDVRHREIRERTGLVGVEGRHDVRVRQLAWLRVSRMRSGCHCDAIVGLSIRLGRPAGRRQRRSVLGSPRRSTSLVRRRRGDARRQPSGASPPEPTAVIASRVQPNGSQLTP
jgi:hypothetical protein